MASVKDPVCGMTIDSEHAADHQEYEGQTYFFCAKSCAARFRAEPAKFIR